MEERRKSERMQLRLLAHCETPSGTHNAVVLNGSAGGCFVRAQVEEPGDDPLKIEIQLPHGEWIHLWGEVVYYLPTEGFGLQFTGPAAQGEAMLKKWRSYLSSLHEQTVSATL